MKKPPNIEFLKGLIGHQGDDCITWPFFRDPTTGRGRVYIDQRPLYAHRVMCELAHGSPPTVLHEAAHDCGKGHEGCVNPNHLSWKTPSENQRDRRKHGTHSNGSGPCALLPEQVEEIRAMRGQKTQREVGMMFGVHWTSIGNIWRGVTWAGEKQRRRRRA